MSMTEVSGSPAAISRKALCWILAIAALNLLAGSKWLVLGLLSILCVLLWMTVAKRRLRHRQEEQAIARYSELKRMLFSTSAEIKVEGASGLLLVGVCVLVGIPITVMAAAKAELFVVLAAVVWWLFSIFALLTYLSNLGKPVLTLSARGIATPGYGFIPWEKIQGIELTRLPMGKLGSQQFVKFFVPELMQLSRQFHLSTQLLLVFVIGKLFRQTVSVPLRDTSELPHHVEQLCKDAWKNATGRDHYWSSIMGEAQTKLFTQLSSRALQAGDESVDSLRRRLDSTRALMADADKEFRVQAYGMTWLKRLIVICSGIVIVNAIAPLIANFVASDTWTLGSLTVAVVTTVASLLVWWPATRAGMKDTLKLSTRFWMALGLAVHAALLFLLVLFGAIHLGDPFARRGGIPEEITVQARKVDSNRRRRCDTRLESSDMGRDRCLTQEQFDRLPRLVPVKVKIRRAWTGYHVDSVEIVWPESAP